MVSFHYVTSGLTNKQARKNLLKFGYNEFKTKKDFTILKIILSQFLSFLIIILVISGSIAIFLGELVDGLAIFAIVILNAIIGFIQEYKAENAVAALKKMVVPEVIVLRDRQEKSIPVREVVPGDIVILSEGDRVPADLEIIEAFSLQVDESVLTGESLPLRKTAAINNNRLFKGTIINTGRATALVLTTGMNTEFGKIVNLVSSQEKDRSPLSIQLDNLGKKIGLVILFLVSILFVLGAIYDVSIFEMLMTSVALGVSAIPEGMPIIVTLTLAMGVQMLASKKAIVRKMNSIETLGATTVICSDKTGTLTLNELTVKRINTNFTEKLIPGLGYSYEEKIKIETDDEKKLMIICENCNNAFFGKKMLGDPTEIALKILTRKANHTISYKKLDELVFTSERKMMSSLHKIADKKEIFTKGAYEEIIKRCSFILKNGKIEKLNEEEKRKLEKIGLGYANEALRVLGFAFKEHRGEFDENDLVFVGLVGMIDPERKTVKESIEKALKAGIQVRIITGDNPLTAKAIGQRVGLNIKNILTGDEIDKLSDRELLKAIYKTDIFARTKPQHKYRIVDLLKRNGEVVAVTGDGVNDAPALKHADVGIAMGIKGTEATKEVADIILKDDNFSTIVNTIEEGRRIYQNILAFIKYMLSANFGSLVLVGLLTVLGYPLPLLPLQILWINIATDALPALALGKSRATANLMTEKPHPKQENIFKKFLTFIVVSLSLQTAIYVIIFFYGNHVDAINNINTGDLTVASHARTMTFTAVVVFELFFTFICKEEKSINLKSFWENKFLIGAVLISTAMQLIMVYTPFMQKVFKTIPLNGTEWLLIVSLSLSALLVPSLTRGIKKILRVS